MMRPNVSLQVLAILVFATLASRAEAVIKVPGEIQTVPEITTFQTWGGPPPVNNMEGIKVTAIFADGTEDERPWISAGYPAQGGGTGDLATLPAAAIKWELRNLTDDIHTFNHEWELRYDEDGLGHGNLTAFEIDGFGKFEMTGEIEGNTAFDTTFPSTGTPGSLEGRDFNAITPHAATATYSDAIRVNGNPVVGDLYRRLRVDFKGRVDSKWRQPPVQEFGENIHSDIDWRLAMGPNGDRQAAADDFLSDGRPITGVRWWGSYFNPDDQPKPDPMNQNLVPPVEEGYVISFFASPAGAAGPGQLLGTYAAPVEAVDIQSTPLVGWDGHPVWEYAVDLDQTLLEHASDLAEREAFLEQEGTEYWISIAAEDGHAIDPETGETMDTGDEPRSTPWWGWHTTPERVDIPNFNDEAPYAANVLMPEDEWVYEPWNIAPQEHSSNEFNNMAFELLTVDPNVIGLDGVGDTMMSFYADTDTVVAVPELSSLLLLAIGLTAALASSARRHVA